MNRQIRSTDDGSHTIYVEELDETYHSSHGAIQEANHVFLESGLKLFQNQSIRIFEMGFGTGLNALLSWLKCEEWNIKIEYLGIEAFPVEQSLIDSMNYSESIYKQGKSETSTRGFEKLHSIVWNQLTAMDSSFSILKIHEKIENYSEISDSVDLIYFDAFGPRTQGAMWDMSILEKMFKMLKSGGCLVTYCAQGQVKRDLKSLGFVIESLPGPPGKREMTRARKV